MLHVRPPGAKCPTVLMGTDGNAISGWEIGSEPRCTLVMQSADVTDEAAVQLAAPIPHKGHHPPAAAPTVAQPAPSAHSICALLAPLEGGYAISAGEFHSFIPAL